MRKSWLQRQEKATAIPVPAVCLMNPVFRRAHGNMLLFIKVLTKQDAMQLVAVFVLLSIYISILSLTACSVMSYVRSLTVALDNKNMFADLRRLGAAKAYTERVLRIQLKKIYLFPTAAGCIIGILFAALLTFFNDMRIDVFELNMAGSGG